MEATGSALFPPGPAGGEEAEMGWDGAGG